MYASFLSEPLVEHLLHSPNARKTNVPGLVVLTTTDGGSSGGGNNACGADDDAAWRFVCSVFTDVRASLQSVLSARAADREWIDAQTKSLVRENQMYQRTPRDAAFASVIGRTDRNGKVVAGPRLAGEPPPSSSSSSATISDSSSFTQPHGDAVAPLPPHLLGPHVTLFGPPDDEKLCINALNALHRQLPNEPAIIAELVNNAKYVPKW
jgi:hypothetical protein